MAIIRAILFDKDGTLVDFNATWLEFARELASEAAAGVEARSEELLELVGFNVASGQFRPGSAVAAGTSVDIISAMYPHLAGDQLRPLVADADRRAADIATERAVPLTGALEAVATLHRQGYRLGVATNDATTGAEKTLLAFGVAHLFEAAYGYDAVANPKPAPDVVYAFADTLGIRPAEVAMVGDNLHDIETARAAGAGLAIGVLSGNSAMEDLAPLADVVLPSVAALPQYLADAV